ncbi:MULTISPECIES: hypothetical protein [unclassified Lysobacter]|uniref:hypothetical protein n=2 Tax=Lysobacter TaxID=68 RepID=UPI001BEB1B57|nr:MULTISPECIES: hypothetical protein [unclassified Lysobacter]MBT2744945.1 hypothetical protein [Lysobacter sp. ISL-42]MBT2752062.1 hypothetical protein [Lysobacter sp. ISL-50]MBT2778559.1 hypothetical protein [Lysobacter sp. ISL-54]MBT2780510.1 hypothetical protein [Lysobacter sp. ISL-52]
MAERRHPHAPPSRADGEGMRVIAKASATRGGALPWVVAVVVIVVALAAWLWMREPVAVAQAGMDRDVATAAVDDRSASTHTAQPAASLRQTQDMPSNDPDDLASYFQPGDPEPTGAQVIEALQQAGVRTGLGAFNPPGTSPPLIGLAVPEGYELPEGYVRHHQVTDEGVAIEPILMFSPDFILRDVQGRPMAMPADRVVPPALAPPGMPRRQIRIPPR